ncbi:S-adenosyl-L-methionine-dependent methyltransferase [Lophium mytilinum]|uniref:S-adenosyl-L-methionine-dependent methyltransferase n=1 Tax=Lophium mytilinum TaxID=390894 RepID=A0A6A6QQW7_9PEZI|nr:S-adenosyl-L-methionine-dependent methyltransferase [Lophium mytilinum]
MAFEQKGDDWSANAKHYNALPQDDESPITRPSVVLVKTLNDALSISEATVILDVGCGPGTTIGMLIRQLGSQIPPDARLIASDFSTGMIEQLEERKKTATDPLWNRIEPLVSNAEDLAGIDDSSISHVMGSLVYNLIPDSQKALQAAYRVLKPGGVVCMSTWTNLEWMDLMKLAAENTKGNTAPASLFPESWLSMEGIKKMFEQAGFKDSTFEIQEAFMAIDDPAPYFNGFVRAKNPAANLYIGGYTEEELDRFEEEWIRLAIERHPKSPKKLKGVFVVSTGRK